MQRCVEPELLDHLPASDPGAMRSRRDMARVNVLMGHPGIMARALTAHSGNHGGNNGPRLVLDLGAGDGTFMLRVARRLAPRWAGCTIVLLDQQDIVSAETRAAFGAIGWKVETVAADVMAFFDSDNGPSADVVTANLFLHHFHDAALSRLLSRIAQRARLLVACEPRRAVVPHLGSRLLWAVGCNHVTRNDAAASVRAGFRGAELSALWPGSDGWQLHERAAGLFSHSFVALRCA